MCAYNLHVCIVDFVWELKKKMYTGDGLTKYLQKQRK